MTAFKSHRHALDANGFTLLEIMVSIAILALVLVTLFRLQSSTLKLAGHGKFNGLAPFLARQQLAVLEMDLKNPGNLSGDFGQTLKGYEWSCTIEDAAFEEPSILSEQQLANLKRINLKITGPGKDRSYTLTTWRYLIEKQDDSD
ncbi:MAG: prepilin-type N-terminal cleavage/methylation domain-containing protein [Proteobacteria bacterium]|nr:prepilin-type N-terminal cleavage/methylation domain-containing protein [Pseudomonadota bacterium]